MPVGNVERLHLSKLLSNQLLVLLVGDHPELMAEAVDGGHEVINGRLGGIFLAQFQQHGARMISQEHRFDVG